MKYYYILFSAVLVASCNKEHSQISTGPVIPHDTTANTYGGSADDGFVSTIAMPGGGFLSAGYSASNDRQVTGNHGGYDYWVVRTDSAGKIRWQKSYGGSGNDKPTQMIATTDGNYAIVGNSESTDGDLQNPVGPLWVIKIDNLGNIIWQKSYGVPSMAGTCIDNALDGGLAFIGNVDNGEGVSDLVLFKTDALGKLVYGFTFGGTVSYYGYGIKAVSNGYVVAGYSGDTIGQVSVNHGAGDMMILKIGFDGLVLWKHVYGGTAADTAYSIVQSPDDGFLIAGCSESHDGDIKINYGGIDLVLCKLDTGGILQWINTYGGSGRDGATFVNTTSDANYLVTGYTASTCGDVSGNHGMIDSWVLKVNQNGNRLSQKTCGGSNIEQPGEAIETTPGHFMLAGRTQSTDGDVNGTHGGIDAWLFGF